MYAPPTIGGVGGLYGAARPYGWFTAFTAWTAAAASAVLAVENPAGAGRLVDRGGRRRVAPLVGLGRAGGGRRKALCLSACVGGSVGVSPRRRPRRPGWRRG